MERGRKSSNQNIRNAKEDEDEKVKFLFATGGAGFCISRALALKMMPLASNGKFVAIGDKIRFPDDVTLGFIIEYLLKVPLTVVNPFHSHLERMDNIDVESFRDQVINAITHSKCIEISQNYHKVYAKLIIKTTLLDIVSNLRLIFSSSSHCRSHSAMHT